MKRGHKFIMSGMMFGFCMARIIAQIMRIVWAVHPTDIQVAIAAQVFVAAGVVLLFVVNLIFAQRIVRSAHPHAGWHPIFHWFFIGLYVWIVMTLAMIITAVIQSFYTLNANTRRIDRAIQLYGQTAYTVVALLPILMVIGGLVIPRKTRLEKFGSGRWREKVSILIMSSLLLCLGAAFRAGVNFAGGTRTRDNPAGYQSKACFYIFNYVIEFIVILAYVVVRVDKRFYVPNGSHGPGDYSKQGENLKVETRGEGKLEQVISPEEEVFDDMATEEVAKQMSSREMKDEEKAMSLPDISTPAPVIETNGHAPEPALSPQEKKM